MSQSCPKCGAELPEDRPGPCPGCLLRLSADEPTPETIGPYRMLERIGVGGMGEVWQASQRSPVRRKVALKIIKHGLDSKQVVARFEAERQALALMDHASVAKVFDAGETDLGRPYFVMEYVEGMPITDYCDRMRLSTTDRLALFTQVCAGVQHAHQKGVIHRDLKPSNVLATSSDDEVTAKIIDFGIAKATAQPLTERTLFTEQGALLGTPEYMSPEQVQMTAEDVDTRSDVYSLGVLLYELLVGALPFEPEELRLAGFDEMRRKIREDEPSKPSARLSILEEERSRESAARRNADLSTLRNQLREDLDWIVMKALEKDRTRRYGSPAELAADIARHLRDEPVIAGPPSRLYRARKFVRRHRLAVGIAAASIAVLLGFSAVMARQANRIAAERDRAEQEQQTSEQVSRLLVEMLSDVDPQEMGTALWRDLRDRVAAAQQGRGATAEQVDQALASMMELFSGVNATGAALHILDEQVLGRASARIERELADQPLITARLEHALGIAYWELGLLEPAEQHTRRAIEVADQSLGSDHPTTLTSTHNLAVILADLGRYQDAERLHRETLRTQERVLGLDDSATLASRSSLATVLAKQGRYEESLELHEQVLEVRKRGLGAGHPDTLAATHNLALIYANLGRHSEAEQLQLSAVEELKRVLGPEHPHTLTAMSSVAGRYTDSQRHAEAERLHREVLAVRRQLHGDEHPDTLGAMANVASSCARQGRFGEAAELHERTLTIRRRTLGNEHPDTLSAAASLAADLAAMRRFAEADTIYRETLDIQRRTLGFAHPDTIRTSGNFARNCLRQGHVEEAERLTSERLDFQRRVLGHDHRETLTSMSSLAGVYVRQGKHDDAQQLIREALEIKRRKLGPEHAEVLQLMFQLAFGAAMQGDHAEAKELNREVLEIRQRTLGEEHPDTLASMVHLANDHARLEQYDDARRLTLEVLRIRKKVSGEVHPETARCLYNLACIEALLGNRAAGLDYLQQSVDAGWSNLEALRQDPDLDPLRGTEFDAIVEHASTRFER